MNTIAALVEENLRLTAQLESVTKELGTVMLEIELLRRERAGTGNFPVHLDQFERMRREALKNGGD